MLMQKKLHVVVHVVKRTGCDGTSGWYTHGVILQQQLQNSSTGEMYKAIGAGQHAQCNGH